MFKSLLIFLLFLQPTYCFDKNWIWSNEWFDKNNWQPSKLPCPDDRITLGDGIIYVKGNVSVVDSLTLPQNGEIVLGANSELVVQNSVRKSDGVCAENEPIDIRYVGVPAKVWLNPLNWQTAVDGFKNDYIRSGAPFIERIPCENDGVVFPEGGAFTVQITDPIKVNSISLDRQKLFDDEVLQTYLKSSEGNKRFQMTTELSSLSIASNKACPKEGCLCGTSKLKSEICKTFNCPKPCKKKVLPFQDCCYRCGAIIEMTFDSNFNLRPCWNKLGNILQQNANYSGVRLYMSRIKPEIIQLLLSDEEDGTASESAVYTLKTYLESVDKSDNCSHKALATIFSKNTIPPPEAQTDSKVTVISLSIILPIVIFILIVVFIATWRRKRRSNEPVKFTNDITTFPGIDGIEYKTSDFIENYQGGGVSFTNPTYDVMQDPNANVEDTHSPKYDIPVSFFKEHKVEMHDEKKTVDVSAVENPAYNAYSMEPGLDKDETGAGDDGVGVTNPLYAEIFDEKVDVKNNNPVDDEDSHDVKDEEDEEEVKKNDTLEAVEELTNNEDTQSVDSLQTRLKLQLKLEEDRNEDQNIKDVSNVDAVKDQSEA